MPGSGRRTRSECGGEGAALGDRLGFRGVWVYQVSAPTPTERRGTNQEVWIRVEPGDAQIANELTLLGNAGLFSAKRCDGGCPAVGVPKRETR